MMAADNGHQDAYEGAPSPSYTAVVVDIDRLIPQDEFFLDIFMDRYPADGGYRVRRFYGYEFFDEQQERIAQGRRKSVEAALDEEFRQAGFRPTTLPEIQMPLRDVPVRAGGFRSHKGVGFPVHMAYDMMAPEGTPVHPIGSGIVLAVEGEWWKKINQGLSIRIEDRSWWDTAQIEERPISLKSGNFVVIYHPPPSESNRAGYYSYYAHLADGIPVRLGQIVDTNAVIGYVEHSGYNAMRMGHGGHLHISVLKDIGNGYLEPIKFGKHLGLREERPPKRRSKALRKVRKGRLRGRRHD